MCMDPQRGRTVAGDALAACRLWLHVQVYMPVFCVAGVQCADEAMWLLRAMYVQHARSCMAEHLLSMC